MYQVIIPGWILVTYLAWSVGCLVRNIWTAASIGLPVRWSPVTPSNPFWIWFGSRLSPLINRLPFGLGEWTDYTTIDWHWTDRMRGDSQVHRRYGDTFVQVTPSGLALHTRDPTVAQQVLKKLPKIRNVARMLDVCGPNLVSTNEEDWHRHRKITVTTLNDRNNRLVWAETVRQSRQLVERYAVAPVMVDIVDCVERLYLHVLTRVCFGVQYHLNIPPEQYIPPGHQRTYRDSLATSLRDISRLHLVPRWAFKLPSIMLPRRVREFHGAAQEMRQYVDEMIEGCKRHESEGQEEDEEQQQQEAKMPDTQNLLEFMVRNCRRQVSDAHTEADDKGDDRVHYYLTENEVRGNLFIYSLGGHESNTHTLLFAVYLLAAFPQVQAWVVEELDAVFGKVGEERFELGSSDTFVAVFGRLTRTLAVMYETLRLYPSIIYVPKTTGDQSVHVKCRDGSIVGLPRGMNVWVNMASMQVHEELWGTDAREWRPSRWVSQSRTTTRPSADADADADHDIAGDDHDYDGGADTCVNAGAGHEKLQLREDGAFVAWGEGKRVCPGLRFSQVAFVAALATLLRSHCLEVVPREGETLQEARFRTLNVLEETYVGTTISMCRPGSVQIELRKRT